MSCTVGIIMLDMSVEGLLRASQHRDPLSGKTSVSAWFLRGGCEQKQPPCSGMAESGQAIPRGLSCVHELHVCAISRAGYTPALYGRHC